MLFKPSLLLQLLQPPEHLLALVPPSPLSALWHYWGESPRSPDASILIVCLCCVTAKERWVKRTPQTVEQSRCSHSWHAGCCLPNLLFICMQLQPVSGAATSLLTAPASQIPCGTSFYIKDKINKHHFSGVSWEMVEADAVYFKCSYFYFETRLFLRALDTVKVSVTHL